MAQAGTCTELTRPTPSAPVRGLRLSDKIIRDLARDSSPEAPGFGDDPGGALQRFRDALVMIKAEVSALHFVQRVKSGGVFGFAGGFEEVPMHLWTTEHDFGYYNRDRIDARFVLWHPYHVDDLNKIELKLSWKGEQRVFCVDGHALGTVIDLNHSGDGSGPQIAEHFLTVLISYGLKHWHRP